MIAGFSFLMWALALAVPVYWTLPAGTWRMSWLLIVSAGFLWLLSPLIFLTLLLYCGLIAGFVAAHRAQVLPKAQLKKLTWGLFAPMIALEFVSPDLWAAGLLGQSAQHSPLLAAFAFLGLSYTAIRSFMLVREAMEGQGIGVLRTLTALLFFGSFAAGPIAGGAPYRRPAERLTAQMALMALARIGWGSALFIVIKPRIERLDLAALTGAQDQALAWLELYRDFLVLYIDFTGYSDVAIGTALLFGITLPENFRWPLRATSIQEFWQRWHLSLGSFIGTYLFKPFVRYMGKPTWAIFLAFSCVGIWHSVTLPYFLWGIGHGAALALNMILRKRIPVQHWPKPLFRLNQAVGWVVTMTYVALLSKFANQATLADAISAMAELV